MRPYRCNKNKLKACCCIAETFISNIKPFFLLYSKHLSETKQSSTENLNGNSPNETKPNNVDPESKQEDSNVVTEKS
jgi:hypothetical protein